MRPLTLNDYTTLEELESNLLGQLNLSFAQENCINDNLLESLHFLHGNPLLEALNQFDKYESESNPGEMASTNRGEIDRNFCSRMQSCR